MGGTGRQFRHSKPRRLYSGCGLRPLSTSTCCAVEAGSYDGPAIFSLRAAGSESPVAVQRLCNGPTVKRLATSQTSPVEQLLWAVIQHPNFLLDSFIPSPSVQLAEACMKQSRARRSCVPAGLVNHACADVCPRFKWQHSAGARQNNGRTTAVVRGRSQSRKIRAVDKQPPLISLVHGGLHLCLATLFNLRSRCGAVTHAQMLHMTSDMLSARRQWHACVSSEPAHSPGT